MECKTEYGHTGAFGLSPKEVGRLSFGNVSELLLARLPVWQSSHS